MELQRTPQAARRPSLPGRGAGRYQSIEVPAEEKPRHSKLYYLLNSRSASQGSVVFDRFLLIVIMANVRICYQEARAEAFRRSTWTSC